RGGGGEGGGGPSRGPRENGGPRRAARGCPPSPPLCQAIRNPDHRSRSTRPADATTRPGQYPTEDPRRPPSPDQRKRQEHRSSPLRPDREYEIIKHMYDIIKADLRFGLYRYAET